jgi:Tol biopolymer transport system component
MPRRITLGVLAAFAAGCGGEGMTGPIVDPTSVGTLLVRVTTTGLDPDPDGYAVGPTSDSIVTLPPNGSATIQLKTGGRIVRLIGQAPNCVPEGLVSRSVVITHADTATLDFSVVCFRDPILFNRQNADAQDENIWVVDASGGPAVDLTGAIGHSAWFDGNGSALSPDRARLVFSSDRDNTVSSVYIMALNKSSVVRVATGGIQGAPAWSPDARRLAYFSYESGGTTDIWVIDADGSRAHPIVATPDAWEFSPTWSPDGSKIAFERDNSAGDRPYGFLVVANADGSGELPVTDGAASAGYAYGVDAHARWAPDGSRIVFERQEITGDYTAATTDLWVVNTDASGLARLTNTPNVHDQHAEWRDDGAVLVWSGCTGGCRLSIGRIGGWPSGDVWQMNADGSGITNVTNTGTDLQPAWNATRTFMGAASPSTALVITRFEGTAFHLYRVNPDGNEAQVLTSGPLNDVNPQWR